MGRCPISRVLLTPLTLYFPAEFRQSRASATNVGQAKDLIGDVYIWGAPSGAIGTGRNVHNNSSAEGLQESWVPALVHDTFRLDVAAVRVDFS
jgi:hypothetical protein